MSIKLVIKTKFKMHRGNKSQMKSKFKSNNKSQFKKLMFSNQVIYHTNPIQTSKFTNHKHRSIYLNRRSNL